MVTIDSIACKIMVGQCDPNTVNAAKISSLSNVLYIYASKLCMQIHDLNWENDTKLEEEIKCLTSFKLFNNQVWAKLTCNTTEIILHYLRFQKPSTSPSSTCLDQLQEISCMLFVQQQHVCGFTGSSKSLYLLCSSSSNNRSSSSVADLFHQDQIH